LTTDRRTVVFDVNETLLDLVTISPFLDRVVNDPAPRSARQPGRPGRRPGWPRQRG
jgi:hypothetical protein